MNLTELAGLMDSNEGLTIRITKNGEILAITVLPDTLKGKKIPPYTCSGTPEQLDANFIADFSNAKTVTTEFVSNLTAITEEAAAKLAAAKAKNDNKKKANTGKKEESTNDDMDETNDDDDDDDTTTTTPKEVVAKPIKLKKAPKDVIGLAAKLKSSTDPMMIEYCKKGITDALVKAKWTELEINAFLAENTDGKIPHMNSVSPEEAFPLATDTPEVLPKPIPVTQADIDKATSQSSQATPQSSPIAPIPASAPVTTPSVPNLMENNEPLLEKNITQAIIEQEEQIQQSNSLLNPDEGGLLF